MISEETAPLLGRQTPITGAIKSSPEDFVVKEITRKGVVLEPGRLYDEVAGIVDSEEGPFSIFVLQKTGWNTMQALKAVAKAHGRGAKSVGFAGTKDRIAVSVQLCSIFGVRPENVMKTRIKDISINGAWKSDKGVKLGYLLGNRFMVKVRKASNKANLQEIEKGLKGIFPNYYANQRFGYRDNNAEIGLAMLREDYRKAVLLYLTDTTNEMLEESANARKRLADELDFKEALRYFPRHLKYERSVIDYLSRFPGSYANSLRRLPRQLALMFIHSVESYIFNMELAERVRRKEIRPQQGDYICDRNSYGFPDINTARRFDGIEDPAKAFVAGNIVGYGTEKLTDTEGAIMRELELFPEMFKLKGMPELSSKGTFRPLFAPYLGFRLAIDKDPVLEFSLPNGSYATSFLREFVAEPESRGARIKTSDAFPL